ncbi:MAG: UDP-N-acetylmuramoyl-tripeptide--D-alanyl-D-alanine ligase [Bdellovibrionaceae bacterium]|nr:UDP-N-acetylmuramoyl-tripeptide--D-alanyl-D-alanine ligase [Pseudobdellovibrionaceae bacterium]
MAGQILKIQYKKKMSEIITTDFLIKALQAEALQTTPFDFLGVSLDSRKKLKDKVFFAIKGKNFDGHDFLSQALEKGAKAFVVSDKKKAEALFKKKEVSIFLVKDTLKALQDLAQSWRKALKIKIIAITGSNGKSTTCSFAHTLLSDFSVFVSPKSYNNFIGVPLSILNVNKKSSFLVQEIGTNAPGEISFLTQLCQPDISLVTMVAPSHLEGLKNLESIAQEKKQIYLKSPKAVWLFNKDNLWTKKMWEELAKKDSIYFSSQDEKADVNFHFLKESIGKSVIKGHIGDIESSAELLFSGQENLSNLMGACAVALSLGAKPDQIWKKVSQCHVPKGRQEYFFMEKQKVSILFDAYNANPASMNFFLKTCQKASQSRILILGDMKELGEDSKKYHKELACHPCVLEARCVFFIGEYSALIEEELKKNNFKGKFKAYKTYNKTLLTDLKKELKTGDFLGLKASRSLALERLAFNLTGKDFLA